MDELDYRIEIRAISAAMHGYDATQTGRYAPFLCLVYLGGKLLFFFFLSQGLAGM